MPIVSPQFRLETSPYIKDLPNQWVTCDGRTVISCADHFCEKESESEKNSSKSVCNSKSQLCRQKLPTDCVGLLYTARFLVAFEAALKNSERMKHSQSLS